MPCGKSQISPATEGELTSTINETTVSPLVP
jgi:hypothetical protein